MTDQITLTGSTDYHPRFPPTNAKKGYVARITGRAAGAVKYQRDFLGHEATLLAGDEGLYERQRADKKGGYTRWYHVVLSLPDHGLVISTDCEDELAKIVKLLDQGVAIADAVEVCDLRPSESHTGRMIFSARARSAAEARSVRKVQSVDSAVAACWEILGALPPAEAKTVLRALRDRVNPPQSAAEVGGHGK